jgi:hypothetical protein
MGAVQGTLLSRAELDLVGRLWASPPAARSSIVSADTSESDVPQQHSAHLSTMGSSTDSTRSCAMWKDTI